MGEDPDSNVPRLGRRLNQGLEYVAMIVVACETLVRQGIGNQGVPGRLCLMMDPVAFGPLLKANLLLDVE